MSPVASIEPFDVVSGETTAEKIVSSWANLPVLAQYPIAGSGLSRGDYLWQAIDFVLAPPDPDDNGEYTQRIAKWMLSEEIDPKVAEFVLGVFTALPDTLSDVTVFDSNTFNEALRDALQKLKAAKDNLS